MSYRNGQKWMHFSHHISALVLHFTIAPQSNVERSPTIRLNDTLLPVEESTNFLGLWRDEHLSFGDTSVCQEHSASVCKCLQIWNGEWKEKHSWSCTWSLFTPQAGLWIHYQHNCQPTTIGQQHSTKTGTCSMLHQSCLHYVHWRQWSCFRERLIKTGHALPSDGWYLHPKSGTLCHAWIWLKKKRFICHQTKWNQRDGLILIQPVGPKVEAVIASREINVEITAP